MLDFLGTVATVALTIFIIATLLVFLDVSRETKIVMAALLGLWVGIATAGRAAGWAALARPFPVMGLFVAAPLTAAVIASAWPGARRAMLGLPLPLLVGMNVGRVFAVLFLLVAAEGRMSGPFPSLGRMGRHHQRRGGAAADLARPRSGEEQGRPASLERLRHARPGGSDHARRDVGAGLAAADFP